MGVQMVIGAPVGLTTSVSSFGGGEGSPNVPGRSALTLSQVPCPPRALELHEMMAYIPRWRGEAEVVAAGNGSGLFA